MPRAFDRLTPQADFDPTNVLEFDPIKALRQSGELWQVILNGIAEFAENLVKEVIQRLIGGLVDPGQALEDLWPELDDWIDGLGLGDIIGILTGIAGGDESDLQAWVQKLLRGEVFSSLPVPALTNRPSNLLPSPNFESGSINPNGAWTEDASTLDNGTFSARATANGTTQPLRSGRTPKDAIPVTPGQTFTARIRVRHMGYLGSGPAILLQVVPFTGTVEGKPEALTNEIAAPGGGSQTILVPETYTPTLPDLDWPGHELSGSYLVPEGVTGIQLRPVLTRDALAGDFWLDGAVVSPNSQLPLSWMPEVQAALQNSLGRVQVLVDGLFNIMTGGNASNVQLTDLIQAFQAIPAHLVTGALGGANILEDLQEMVNAAVGGIVGQQGSGASLADLFNQLFQTSSNATQGSWAWEQWGIRDNKPVSEGLLATGTANYPYPMANTWLPVAQSTSLCVVKREPENASLGVVSFLAYTDVSVTACYINIREINPDTGARELIHHSPNVIAELTPTTPGWVFYNPEPAIPRKQSTTYEYQIVPVGGTINVRGMALDDDIPDHPDSDLVALGAVRNETSPTSPATSIAKASVVSSPKVMWIETAIDTGSGSNYHDPVTIYFNADGSLPIPKWAKYIDRVPVGAGGGARKGFFGGFFGAAGEPGKFNADTLERGVDFDNSDTVVTFTKGVGGASGSSAGSAGTASSFTVGDNTITADGGIGGTDLKPFSPQVGRGPGTLNYNDIPYVAGGDQKTLGGAGTSPGGAGNGGDGFGFQSGGRGGDGGGWVTFRPGAVDGGSIDITPPDAPSLVVDSATYSTITVTVTGPDDAVAFNFYANGVKFDDN